MDKKLWEKSELEGLTDEQLLEIAIELGAEFNNDASKEQIIEAILKAQEAAPPQTPDTSETPSQDNGAAPTPSGEQSKPKTNTKNNGGTKQGGKTGSADDPDPQYPIGALITRDGKEMVKVAPGTWLTVTRVGETDNPDDKVSVKIRNEALKGQKVFTSSGIAEFDDNGVVMVSAREADRLCKIPGYSKVE